MSNSAKAILGYGLVLKTIENSNETAAIEKKYLAATNTPIEKSQFKLQDHGNMYCETDLLVFIKDSVLNISEYDEPLQIDSQKLVINLNWDQLLQNFCTAVKMNYQNPSWKLCAGYG